MIAQGPEEAFPTTNQRRIDRSRQTAWWYVTVSSVEIGLAGCLGRLTRAIDWRAYITVNG